jgi:hypothetical protein
MYLVSGRMVPVLGTVLLSCYEALHFGAYHMYRCFHEPAPFAMFLQ